MPGIYDLMRGIQQQGEEGRKRGLQALVGKAYAAPQDQRQQILATVAQRGDPGMALEADKAFGAQEDNVHLQMAKRAREVVALYKANPQMAQQIYQNGLIPIAQRAGIQNAPMQLDDSLIPGLEKLASAIDGEKEQRNLAVSPGSAIVDPQTGRVVYERPYTPYVRDQPGTPFDILDKGTGGSIYGQQQPQQGQPQQWAQNGASYQTPAGIVKLDGVAPEDMAAVQADMLSGGAQDNYALPPRDVSPQGRPPARPLTTNVPDTFVPLSSDEIAQMGLPAGTVAQRNLKTGKVEFAPQGVQPSNKPAPVSPAQRATDTAFAKDYVQFIQTGASDAARSLDELDSVIATLGSKNGNISGPVISSLPAAVRQRMFPASMDTQQTVERTIQSSLRAVLGAQYTQKEGEMLLARTYNPALEESENKRRVERLALQLRRALESKQDAARYFEENGTMAGYRGKVDFSVNDFDPSKEGRPQAPQQSASPQAPKSGGVDDLLSKYGVK